MLKTIKHGLRKSHDINKWKDSPCSWIGILSMVVKMSILPRVVYRFSTISIKIPTTVNAIKKIHPKIKWNLKGP